MENEKKLKFNPDDMIAAADEQFLEWMKNGRYAELIDTMPNLGRYSLRNQMLIFDCLTTKQEIGSSMTEFREKNR